MSAPGSENDPLVHVALGSNLGDRIEHIRAGSREIEALPRLRDLRLSSIYETQPMGPQDQPDYLNAVCSFRYGNSAHVLLSSLQHIERLHGRVSTTARWTARPLDLDIVLFGDKQVDEPDLVIPHIGLAERSFVLWPLLELDAEIEVPGLGPAKSLLSGCQQFGISVHTE